MGDRVNIRGEDCRMTIVRNGEVLEELSDSVSVTCSPLMELLTTDLLGETTQRKEELFNGWQVEATVLIPRAKAFYFVGDVVKRARNQLIGLQVNLMYSVRFPETGEVVRLLHRDLRFADLSIQTASRREHVNLRFNAQCSEAEVI